MTWTTGVTNGTQMADDWNGFSTSTGWANYADTQYTEVAPFVIPANTDTVVPNNALSVIDSQKPSDVATFYDGSVITGRNGDGITITVDMKARPTGGFSPSMEIWFDIGGAVGQIYRRLITFPFGSGTIRPVDFSVTGYTLGTWEANGATVYARASNPTEIFDIRYVITRTHKAR